VLVVGLVGGVASGKSAVASVLEREGFVVLDADKDAKAALDREDVRAQLVSWWGEGILSAGRVDRARVADIVFKDAGQRRKLEELVHPIVRADRARAIEAATKAGRAGVVIDAPLLFEAGSEKECDRVLFVDAPLEQRVARATQTRGWTREELERREAAQLPLEQKRARSSDVVVNDSDFATLERRVRTLVVSWRTDRNAGKGHGEAPSK
jgi:dephospho-CoA kinase